MAGNTLRFTVEVAADQATGALNALSAAFNKAGIDANTKLLGMGRASREAANEVSGLSGKLKEFASEQRQQGRVANFYVRELAELAPVSDTVKVALGGVVGALAGGFGLGMAIDLVVTGAKLLVDHLGKAAKEAEAFAKDSAKAIDDLDKRIDALRNKSGGEKALNEWRLIQLQIEGYKEQKAALEASTKAARADTSLSTFQLGEITKGNDALIQRYGEQIVQLERRSEKLQEIVKLEVLGADSKAAEEAAKKKEEAQKKAAELADKRAQDEYNIAHTLERQTSALERQAEVLAAEGRHKVAEDAKKGTGELSALPNFGGPGGLDKLLDEAGKKEAEHFKAVGKEQDAYNRAIRESIALNQQWGQTVGSVVGAVVTGQMTAGQAIAQIGQQIIQSVVQAAIASITADAARAGAGAAASQAGIPFVGPVLAISAMGAMMSAVMELIGNLPSARNGWWDTGSYEGLAMIHKREMIADAPLANAIRSGGMGGGVTLNVNMQSSMVDTRGMERALTRYDGGLQRGIRQLRRQRRA